MIAPTWCAFADSFLIGLIVPRTLDICVKDIIFVFDVKYFSGFEISNSPVSLMDKYFNVAPVLWAVICQGTILE